MATDSEDHAKVVKEVSRPRQQSLSAEEKSSFDRHVAENAAAVIAQVRETAIEARANDATALHEERGIQQALAVEALDELQIAQEMQGRVITQYFYEFPIGGTTVTGISWAGTKAIARVMAQKGEPITVVSADFQEFDEDGRPAIGCLVRCRNLLTGEERFAWATQSRIMVTRKDGPKADPFAKAKVLNKAQRNGLRSFIPEVVVVEMYKAWKNGPPKSG